MDVQQLEKPFSRAKIRHKKGGYGQTLRYVEWADVVKRLNAVFSGDWSFEIIEWQLRNRTIVVLGKLSVGGISKMQFGSSALDEALPFGDVVKAAASDALKRCSVLTGIGLHLYGSHPRQTRQKPAAQPPPEALSARQAALIRSLGQQLHWSEQELEQQTLARLGRPLAELQKNQASQLIDQLRLAQNDKRSAA